MEAIIKKKAFHCKILIRSILILNKKDEAFFERTKSMIKSMLDNGLCQLKGEQWVNAKKGLVLYFLQNGAKFKEEMSNLFTNSIKENIREEMLSEYEKLRTIV